jgi:hypothetical protein
MGFRGDTLGRPMRSQSETESVVACQQVVAELALLLDHEGLSQIDALFSAHPIVSLFGSEVRGIEEIRALFRSRTEGMVIRHALSPSYVELTSPDSARAITYATVYRGLQQPGFPGPLPLTGPVNFVEYEDQFVRGQEGWVIAKRDIRMIFKAP